MAAAWGATVFSYEQHSNCLNKETKIVNFEKKKSNSITMYTQNNVAK